MKFANSLVAQLSDIHLLKHEFYQAWSAGTIPVETLRLYAEQYYHHVKAFPRYVSATHSNCEDITARQFLLENLNDEEKGSDNHPELWKRFAEGLGCTRDALENANPIPEVKALVDTFLSACRKSYADGLGALFAYEHQIPEIAAFKIDALKKHYCIQDPATLSFFEVHRTADVYHTEAVMQLLEKLSPEEKETAMKSAKVTAEHLWKFLDGIQRSMSV